MKERIILLSNSEKVKKLSQKIVDLGKEPVVYGGIFDIKVVEDLHPDFVISYGYSRKVPRETVKYMENKIINIHPSLLPINRGSYANFWSFIYNTKKGVTIHCLDEGLDTGDILLQQEMRFDIEKETFFSTYSEIEEASVGLVIQHLDELITHKIIPEKQNGISSFHTISKFKRFCNLVPFEWGENIATFLEINKDKIELFLQEEKGDINVSKVRKGNRNNIILT